MKKPTQVSDDDDSIEEYTPKELEALDYYHEYTEKKFTDDDLYEVITKHNFNDKLIKAELDDMMRDIKKGEEYNWRLIGKSNLILFI